MAEIAVRLDTGSVSTEERDIRVDDYLNDKLQIAADLENLDSLLINVKDQQALLKKQVRFSKRSRRGFDTQIILARRRRKRS